MSDIPNEIRKRLKQLYPDPEPGVWDWDEGQWDWELSLRDNGDPGYVAIVPLRDGKLFKYKIKPEIWHNEWAIKFVGVGFDTLIFIRGTLQEAKRHLDMLIGFDTPEIPQ